MVDFMGSYCFLGCSVMIGMFLGASIGQDPSRTEFLIFIKITNCGVVVQ